MEDTNNKKIRPKVESEKKGRTLCVTLKCPELELNFLSLLEEFKAGDPMRVGVLWMNLSRCEISLRLAEMGTP
jgi:hypothetical protein